MSGDNCKVRGVLRKVILNPTEVNESQMLNSNEQPPLKRKPLQGSTLAIHSEHSQCLGGDASTTRLQIHNQNKSGIRCNTSPILILRAKEITGSAGYSKS